MRNMESILVRRLFALVSCSYLLCLTSCTDGPSPATRSGAAAPARVRLGYFANLTHAQAVLGVASGDFEKAIAPAKLETKVFNAGPSLIEALNAGEIDIGYVGPGPAIAGYGRSRGQALRVIAGAAANGVVVVVRKNANINTLDDLNGRRIATPQVGNTQDIAAKHFIKNSSEIIPVPNSEQRALFERGELDAAWVPEPWGAYLVSEAGARILIEEKELWADEEFVLTLVITTPPFLEQHSQILEQVLAVHRSYTARLIADPQALEPQLGEALFRLTQKRLPAGVIADALTRIKFTDEPLPGSLEAMNRWTRELGFTREEASLEGLVDTTLLRKLQGAAGAP
jgi:NitT/TauT family transport system substrate-binding protein